MIFELVQDFHDALAAMPKEHPRRPSNYPKSTMRRKSRGQTHRSHSHGTHGTALELSGLFVADGAPGLDVWELRRPIFASSHSKEGTNLTLELAQGFPGAVAAMPRSIRGVECRNFSKKPSAATSIVLRQDCGGPCFSSRPPL